MDINQLVRDNIKELQPYSSARSEFDGKAAIFLDANENPFGPFNRYPDPKQSLLKAELSKIKGIAPNKIFIGNGSDEVIDLSMRIFCQPQKDHIIICPPTYGMYKVSADINDIPIISVPLDENFQLQVEKILHSPAKMIFICSPNNPTANNIDAVEEILENFQGIVFLDEAYIDFSDSESLITKLEQYPNLIVSQTLSKAWGKAGLRIGIAYATEQIIDYFYKLKPPYNISEPNQQLAHEAIKRMDIYQHQIEEIKSQRKMLGKALNEIKFIQKVYPTAANFFLIKCKNADRVYQMLKEEKIIVRNRNSQIANCLRITIGTKEENNQLLELLKQIESKI